MRVLQLIISSPAHTGYFEDPQLDATLFVPTDDAVFNAAWEDWTADDPRLIGALLYHSVPFKVRHHDQYIPLNVDFPCCSAIFLALLFVLLGRANCKFQKVEQEA